MHWLIRVSTVSFYICNVGDALLVLKLSELLLSRSDRS
jgi:hypothetical protein